MITNLSHGHARRNKHTKIYERWKNMKQRCFNPKSTFYSYYGGRGITVCERWLVFQNFLDDMGMPQEELTLDRLDNNGNYEPSNCAWVTRKEQVRNTRKTRFVEFGGQKKAVIEWAEILGVHPSGFFHSARSKGITVEQAVYNRLQTAAAEGKFT